MNIIRLADKCVDFFLFQTSSSAKIIAFGLTFFFVMVTNVVFSGQEISKEYSDKYIEAEQAYYLALAGIEYSQYIRDKESFSGMVKKDFSEGEFVIEEHDGYLVVVGIKGNTKAKIVQEVD